MKFAENTYFFVTRFNSSLIPRDPFTELSVSASDRLKLHEALNPLQFFCPVETESDICFVKNKSGVHKNRDKR